MYRGQYSWFTYLVRLILSRYGSIHICVFVSLQVSTNEIHELRLPTNRVCWNDTDNILIHSMYVHVCMFVCLFGVYRPTREFFTHMETSPLPVKGCKFWPMLSTYRPLSSEGSLTCHTDNRHLRGFVTLTPNAERLAVELSLPVFTT